MAQKFGGWKMLETQFNKLNDKISDINVKSKKVE